MTDKKSSKGQSGGVNINGSRITVGGDIVGRDKTTKYGNDAQDLAELARQFALIKQKIDQRAEDPDLDKQEISNLVENIEQELKKGEAANPNKIERWLRFLAGMADDIFQVTAATLTHPVAGVAKAIQLIAQKVKEEST
jgi:hypothetical protein